MKTRTQLRSHRGRLSIPNQGSVSTIIDVPSNALAMLVLAHGAGAGMRHVAMEALAEALNVHGIATYRFQFPYMERDSRRPDPPDTAVATIAASVHCAATIAPDLPLFAGGKSFGGRMTTTAASRDEIPDVRGILCFGFPLHPPKKPAMTRADHIGKVRKPILLIQGTRDSLADLSLIKEMTALHPEILALHVVEGADHSFGVLRKSGRSKAEVLAEVAQAAAEFCRVHSTTEL